VETVGAGSDLDTIMDLYGYLSILIMVIVLLGGAISIILAHIEVWKSKRAYRKARREYDQAKKEFLRTHGY
jgi:hypothetical protein